MMFCFVITTVIKKLKCVFPVYIKQNVNRFRVLEIYFYAECIIFSPSLLFITRQPLAQHLGTRLTSKAHLWRKYCLLNKTKDFIFMLHEMMLHIYFHCILISSLLQLILNLFKLSPAVSCYHWSQYG